MARLGWAEDAGQARWLARTYRLRPRDLWLSLRDLGQGAGAALDEAALDGRIRARLRTRLAALADPIEVHQGWDALVLAESQRAVVQEIVAHARHGHTVLDQWGFSARFGPRHSVSCLFSGPPGTGKTLTAGLIAEALGLPAFRVDLARVVDKYVGETEKNLGRLFDEAERVPVVLVFDEADALFGERTEQKSSQDRYANLEVNYLLQRME
ncbi:MAG: AAA family ATPase, partial [Myxococcales bacterium]|nr:AAA family ATPase [Myxococcales bacterium]